MCDTDNAATPLSRAHLAPGSRQHRAAASAFDEGRTERVLEIDDLLAQRGLTHADTLGRFAKVPGIREGAEIFELAQGRQARLIHRNFRS